MRKIDMVNSINNLSLRWKFMLAPSLGIILTILLVGLFLSTTSQQEQSLSRIQKDSLDVAQRFSQLATRLATNHARVYELLKLAAQDGDESQLYDSGKPLLNEVHRIEAETRQATINMASVDLLLTALVDYRKQVITAVEMATVDLSLAHQFMTQATSQFNLANAQFLNLSEIMQQSLESQLLEHHLTRERTLYQFSVLLLIVILVVVITSLLLSSLLSRKLHQSIAILGKLAADEETESTTSEITLLSQVIKHVELNHQHLDDTRRELSQKENRLRTILDNTVDGIVTINDKGIIEDYNAAAETIFGYTAREVLGQNVAILVPTPYKDLHDTYIANYLTTGQAKIIGQPRDVEGLRKDGSTFPLALAINELWIAEQQKFTGILRDISQRVATEKELVHYRESLEDLVKERTAALELSNQELETYSYSIAHDLRGPLRSITSFSQILQEDIGHKLNAEEKDYFERIIKASKRMAELIDDILELGRVTRSEMQHSEVNLTELARDTIEQLSVVYNNRKIDWQIQEDLRTVGDNNLLALLLENLFSNACKYSSKKDRAHIEFGSTIVEKDSGKDSKKIPAYFVSDNGVGFDMQYVDKLFKPFHRLHDEKLFEGTGIGLATVQRIIHRHGGHVWVEAELDKGACFYFTLENQPQ